MSPSTLGRGHTSPHVSYSQDSHIMHIVRMRNYLGCRSPHLIRHEGSCGEPCSGHSSQVRDSGG